MKKTILVRTVVAAALVLSAAAAAAASDYLLEITGIPGESGAINAPNTIEVASWSWGTSNPTTVGSGGMSAGRVAAPKMGDMATLVVMYRESPTRASTGATAAKQGGCVAGTHFSHVALTAKGSRYELTDVTVTSCTDMGNGMRRRELTGHVTLIK